MADAEVFYTPDSNTSVIRLCTTVNRSDNRTEEHYAEDMTGYVNSDDELSDLSNIQLVDLEGHSSVSNNTTNPSENSMRNRLCKVFIGIGAVLLVGVILALVLRSWSTDTKNSAQENDVFGSSALTGDRSNVGGKTTEQHLLDPRVGGTLCNGVVTPYIQNQIEESTIISWEDIIKNSSCIQCGEVCFSINDIKGKTTLPCGGWVFRITCHIIRDMKNKDNGRCGGHGDYVCFGNESDPECQCDNNHIGDNCDRSYKVSCRCWTTDHNLSVAQSVADCDAKKAEDWKQCVKQLDTQTKCLCNRTINALDVTLPDCAQSKAEQNKSPTNGGTKLNLGTFGTLLLVCTIKTVYYLVS
ncbi:hypothetical protein ACF0H5_005170 [Mactra antiquata]